MKSKISRFLFLIALVVVVLGVMLYFAPRPFVAKLSALPPDSQVCIYCRNTSQQAIDLGNGKLVQCSLQDFNKVALRCHNVDGVSVRFSASRSDFLAILQKYNLQVCSAQKLDGLTVVSGYTDKICGGLTLDGKLVNLQVAFDGETLTFGSPLILDSF